MMHPSLWQRRFLAPAPYRVFPAARRPERSLLVWNPDGTYQLHAWNRDNDEKRPLTHIEGGQLFGAISSDGEEIYALLATDGSERGHVCAIPWEGGAAVDLTPTLPLYTAFDIAVARDRSIIGFSASLQKGNALIVIDRAQAASVPRLLYSSQHQLMGPALNAHGTLAAVAGSIPDGDREAWEIMLLLLENGDVLHRVVMAGGHTFPLAIAGEGADARILVTTNIRGYEEPAWLMGNDTTHFLQDHPRHDTYVLAHDADSHKLLCCAVQAAKHQLLLVDGHVPGQAIGDQYGSYDLFFGGGHFLPDDSLLVRHQSSTTSPSLLILPKENRSPVVALSSPSFPCRPFENMEVQTPDGFTVQAWVAFPGDAEQPLPFVIDIHGGPNGITLDAFSPEAQAWLDHGMGYCAVNYRGSISFGKDFEQAIRGKPGTGEVIDCVAVKEELVRRGWAQPDAVILSGWSWGGYITLLALGKEPHHWAGGIAAVPIADWIEQYKKEPPYLQAYDRELFGGSPDEVLERYIKASPMTYVEQLQAPVLIIAGSNDSRCPIEQIEAYVARAKFLKKDVDLHQFSGGHTGAFGSSAIGIDVFTVAKDFLLRKKFPLRDNL